MMAFERIPTAALDPGTVTALRDVLGRAAREGRHDAELGDVLERAAAEARERGVQAEQLLILLKGVWRSLPEVNAADDDDGQKALLQELISRCIEQYYRR